MHATIPAPAPSRLFGKLDPVVETRPDGVVVVRSAKPLPHYSASLVDRLERVPELLAAPRLDLHDDEVAGSSRDDVDLPMRVRQLRSITRYPRDSK